MLFSEQYLQEVNQIAENIDYYKVEQVVDCLNIHKGRVFILGIGGSAANASHMVNDLRKLCNIEAYCPTDNVSELTARTNDEGFETIFENYLRTSNFTSSDCLFILSVGGGDKDRNISVNLIKAIDYCHIKGGKVYGIVGRSSGYTAKTGDCVILVPPLFPDRITPHSEAFQAVIWHCIVSNPKLQKNKTTW